MAESPIATDLLNLGDRITVEGVRVTYADGVDCSRIEADDGRLYAVSYLEPSITIGERVAVSGVIAGITSCRGQVINVESTVRLSG